MKSIRIFLLIGMLVASITFGQGVGGRDPRAPDTSVELSQISKLSPDLGVNRPKLKIEVSPVSIDPNSPILLTNETPKGISALYQWVRDCSNQSSCGPAQIILEAKATLLKLGTIAEITGDEDAKHLALRIRVTREPDQTWSVTYSWEIQRSELDLPKIQIIGIKKGVDFKSLKLEKQLLFTKDVDSPSKSELLERGATDRVNKHYDGKSNGTPKLKEKDKTGSPGHTTRPGH